MALKKGKTLKVLAVCGAGMGTCTLIRSNVETALRKVGISAVVEVEVAANINSTTLGRCDLIFTSKNIAESKLKKVIDEGKVPVIAMQNVMKKPEYDEKVQTVLLPMMED